MAFNINGFQASFTGGEISPDLNDRIDLAKYSTACKALENMQIMPHGGVYKRTGFRYLANVTEPVRLMPFIFSVDQTYMLAWGTNTLSFFTENGSVLGADNKPYTIKTPYSLAEASALSYIQSADVIYLASLDSPVYKLSRIAHDNWTLEKLSFVPETVPPLGVTGFLYDKRTPPEHEADGLNSKYWKFRITSINGASGEESLPSAFIYVLGPENMRNNCYPKLSWNGVAGVTEYRVYQDKSGKYGYIGSAEGLMFDAKNIAPDMLDSFPIANDPFINENYPGSVCFFQQRLVFGGSRKRPQTLWFSMSANYENFSMSSPVKADDSIEVTIASNEVSLIQWMISLRTLLVGTTGVEWEIKGTGEGGAISPFGITILPQSYRGSATIDAQIVGSTILHVGRTYKEVRDLLYSFGSDSYEGTDRALLASHLFENNTITKWTYQQSPDSIVWCCRDDGVLLGMTYIKEHDIYGWHRHITDGKFLDCACVPGKNTDNLFVLTTRIINNVPHYFIEVQDVRTVNEANTINAFYVDCGLSYSGEPIKEISGLNHLLGKTVNILADGGVVAPQIVRALDDNKIGIILPEAASVIHIGLGYTARIQSMGLEPTMQDGSSVGRLKRVVSIGVDIRATNSIKIGASFDKMFDAKLRARNDPPDKPPSPFTGIVHITISDVPKTQITACVESSNPVPLIVLAMTPSFDVFS